MERIDSKTVRFTDAEAIIVEWHDALMDNGRSQAEALQHIEDRVPQGGATLRALQDRDFRAYLLG